MSEVRRYDAKILRMPNERLVELARDVKIHIRNDWEFVGTFGSMAETFVIMRRETEEYRKLEQARMMR